MDLLDVKRRVTREPARAPRRCEMGRRAWVGVLIVALAAGLCPAGARLTLNIDGPDCWDGVNLDSPDHRSHVSHSTYVPYQHCDAAHPYHMPKVSIIAIYTADANFVAGNWHLSSDEMVSGAAPGTTFHADYLEAWSPAVRDGWQGDGPAGPCPDGGPHRLLLYPL